MQNTHLSTLRSLYLAHQVTSSEIWGWISYTHSHKHPSAACLKAPARGIWDPASCRCTDFPFHRCFLIKTSPIWLFCSFMERVRCRGFWSSCEDGAGCKDLPPERAYHGAGRNKFRKPDGNALNCSHRSCSIHFKNIFKGFISWGGVGCF